MDEGLPQTLTEIARVAGVRAALLIGTHHVGQIYIPGRDRLSGTHWLVRLVGLEAALSLATTFGPGTLDIPAALVSQGRQRREAMLRMSDEGLSLNEIATRLGINRSTVVKARRRARRKAGASLPLFGE